MKTIIISIITLIFLIIAFFKELNADESCITDCENSAWSSFQVIPLYLSTCWGTVFIKYRYRIACNIFYDYYIEEVRFSSAIRDCLDRIY